MKRILTFTLVLAVLVALPFSIHAKEWSTVGTNPTTTSIVETMKKMDFDTAVVRFVQQNFPDTTYVMKGMIFNQASQGDAKIQNNVTIGFDSTKALVWRTGDLDVYYVLECNNVLWKAACTESQTIAPAPEESPAPVVTPATTNDAGSFFADWFTKLLKIGLGALLALLLLVALIALLRLLWRVLQHGWESTTTAATPPAPPAPITPIVPPAAQTDPLAEQIELLKRLLRERDALDERISSLKTRIRLEARDRRANLDEIDRLIG